MNKITSIKNCKETKQGCSILKNNQKDYECFKVRKLSFRTNAFNQCEAIRTKLNKNRLKILKIIDNGGLLYWYGPKIEFKSKCKCCNNEITINKKINEKDFWLLYYGEYIEKENFSESNYKITKKGIASVYNEE